MSRLGFIGLGSIGLPMANRLLAVGHELIVNDIRSGAEQGLEGGVWHVARSPKEIADQVEIIFLSLSVPAAVRSVALGDDGIAKGKAAKIVVDLSTTGPQVAVEVSDALAKQGIQLFDAPVSGGVSGAKAGRLSIMAAGPAATYEQILPLLEAIGKPILVGHKPGQGHTMKLLNNLLSANVLAATAEVVVLGVKAGLDAEAIINILNVSSGGNSATKDKFPASVLNRTFNFGFSTRLVHKDVRLGRELAEQLGTPLRIGRAVEETWAEVEKTIGDVDYTRIVQVFEKAAGVIVGKEQPVT